MTMPDVEGLWLLYADMVDVPLRDETGDVSVQWVESRRAFYAGLSALLHCQQSPAIIDQPEEVVLAWMNKLDAECERFWHQQARAEGDA